MNGRLNRNALGGARTSRLGAVERVVSAALAVFGLVISSALLAVVVAGLLQWGNLAPGLDNAVPILVLVLGLMLCGRVAVDIAGSAGVLATVGAAGLVALVGLSISRSTEAHGDGVEPQQVLLAALIVLVLTGGTSMLMDRRRRRRRTGAEPKSN
jgi:hypothetical protein